MNKQEKAEVPRSNKTQERIPDYDGLFQEQKTVRGKNRSRFLGKIVKINLRPILLSLFVYLFQSLPVYLIPLCTSYILDIVTFAVSNGMTNDLWIKAGIALGIGIVSILINVPTTCLRWRIASRALRRTSAGVRLAMVRKLQSLSITYHKDMQAGRVQSKFLKDMETLDGFFSNMLNGFLLQVITLGIFIAMAVVKNGWVSLFFLVVIPFNVLLRRAFYKKIRSAHHDYRVDTENMSAKLTGMIEMIPVTKSHGLEDTEIHMVGDTIHRVERSGKRMDKTTASFGAWAFVVNHGLSILCLAFCAVLAIRGDISAGDVVLFQSMFSSISNSVSSIVNTLPQIYAGREAIDSLSELMKVSEVEINIGKRKIKRVNGDVEFDNVTYVYPHTEQQVVKDFSLNVKKGECIAVVGPSGSGKSTLINMIIGFLLPVKGEVRIDGKSTKDINLSEYRQSISVVPQNSILFSGSIKDNITYGLSHYSEKDLENVLEMANVNEFINELPNGINTNVGEHGDKLSGGQRQRISIARALIRNPQILILDEATSALDNISEYHVQKAISSSIQGRTTFIVAHRLSTIRNADRIIVMENGECVEMGTYDELMAKKGKFFELKNLNDLTNKKAEKELA